VTYDPVRDEAERLVAAAIAALSFAARGIPRGGTRPFANGSEECCVCPICRLIASMRDPNADIAERLASGAGDLATGVASMLRAFGRPGASGRVSNRGPDSDFPEGSGEGEAFWASIRERARGAAAQSASAGDDAWHTATTASPMNTPPPPRPSPPRPSPPRPMAKKAVKKGVKKTPPGLPDEELPESSKKKMGKKAAKKAAPKASTGEE
jgi:hypothetical protein